MTIDLSPSPYLTGLSKRYPEVFARAGSEPIDTLVQAECFALPANISSQPELMKQLREAKNKLALLIAIADLSGVWPLEQVTRTLSEFADYALSQTLNFLLREAAKRGEITLKTPENPSLESGIIILGMGKLGGFELNYSSDIDLILFFEENTLAYSGRGSEQKFMNKLAQDIVSIMQERTAEGYVFRTDLRLRPDPASTPPAINVLAAYQYYESVGQNWERAAMIKARPVAGDIAAGERFLAGLTPYIWRRSLDFAAINDIHSIKRQMDARGERNIQMAGHNIKLGLGGIREIEFYAQIHQLIWGGRKPTLRTRNTCETLAQLVAEGLIDSTVEKTLVESYRFHRTVEHRLQMVSDAQTHTMPDNEEGLENIAHFSGYKEISLFEKDLLGYLHAVHDIYSASFKSEGDLGDAGGNLVFTGVSSDPETVKTLEQMGYKQAERLCEIIMGWHHGQKRCTRTKRARELLTELMPSLLARLAQTANPDAAFLKFDEFLTELPAAVQLFSLFSANKDLLGLIADIMGSAPALADTLSKSPELIENVLFSDFYEALPTKALLTEQASERLSFARDTEEALDHLTYYRNERQFQAGVQFLKGMINAPQLGRFLTSLAEVVMAEVLRAIQTEFEKTYGRIADAEFSIIALGKCGSREMTFHSDLDLVFVYRVPDFETISDGEKGYSASVYYNRFAQRFVNALSQLNRGGKLYDVDTRLRPSGKQGLLAVSDKALSHYFTELAWTFEYMAFTKARAVAGDATLSQWLGEFIRTQIEKPRDTAKLKADVNDMRLRMAEGHTDNLWDLKHVRGGLVDIDFIAQYLLLLHAPAHKGAPIGNCVEIFTWCKKNGLLDAQLVENLISTHDFLNQLFNLLRLCIDGVLDENKAQQGLKKLLRASVKLPDFAALKEKLAALEQSVKDAYVTIVTH